uniref:Olfactomedin-like domain-containing protein n=1 Tax=Salarias fasciatus TaxID=181472 RepID=A0A672G471_SALFA
MSALNRSLEVMPQHLNGPVQDWESGNVTTSVGESGQCVCEVFLPDTSFPADRVESVQEDSKDLLLEVENQKNKLEDYLNELSDLTERLESLQNTTDRYIKLDFELLRIELREFESLVNQLHLSFNSSSPMIESLYTEIQNMTSTVNLLESYDKRNLELIRRSFAELQEKLEECQREQDTLSVITPCFFLSSGNCNHKGILSISKPKVVQINGDLSSSYVYGCWGKDSKPDPGYESMYFYGGSSSTIYGRYYQLYSDYEKLILRSYFKRYSLGNDKGNNYIVHGNAMYYQAYSPLRMGKVNLTSLQLEYRVITEASERFSYSFINDQFLDFAADEKGLWVIYASEQSNGKLIVGKINENFLDIEERHTTSVYKVHATNAFMACGVLYVTRSVDLTTDEIFYAYDTQTSEEKYLNVPFQKFRDQYSYLDYNPTDQKLYMYNSGYYVSYDVRFNKE